jgi:hypothetical protein
MKRNYPGRRPQKTPHDYAMVRITQSAQHRLAALSDATGRSMTELASELIILGAVEKEVD